MFSILHISDIHRDLDDEIPNEWLLESISKDFSRFDESDPKILKPSICVVSGDLVHGVSPRHRNPDTELKRQYNQAEDFLIGLADNFFDGDRERVVILPGNHDVCFFDVMESLEVVEIPTQAEEKKELLNEFFKQNSKLRWSWKDLCFFRIMDEDRYRERFRYFAEMYKSFYQNKRIFPLVDEEQYQIFDYPNLGFSIAALNSCFNNDPFNIAGSFNITTFTRAVRELGSTERSGWLLATAWHHNIAGGPTKTNYLDAEWIPPLIEAGISLVLHGHQNISDCYDEHYRIGPNPRQITVISASTLCAKPKNLLSGVPRSYNIIELNTEDWTGRVHQRMMVNYRFSVPIWGAGRFNMTEKSFFDFKLCPPLNPRITDIDLTLTLEKADMLIGSHQWIEALKILIPIKEVDQVRPLLVGALEELNDARCIIKTLWPPLTEREAIILGGAIYEKGTKKEAEGFIQLDIVSNSQDASVRDVIQRVRLRYNL